jgi:hypothetical protein
MRWDEKTMRDWERCDETRKKVDAVLYCNGHLHTIDCVITLCSPPPKSGYDFS